MMCDGSVTRAGYVLCAAREGSGGSGYGYYYGNGTILRSSGTILGSSGTANDKPDC